jgi:hypothetical protein
MRIPGRATRLFAVAMAALFLLLAPSAGDAGKNPDAKIILNVVPKSNRNTCAAGRVTSHESVVTRGDLHPAVYTVYALVVDGKVGGGISGCQFGIAFNDTIGKGVDIIDWQECSVFNWPTQGWPTESLTGNMLTWNQDTDCDTTGIRVAGYFYVTAYTPGRLSVIARPADGIAAVAGCGIEPGTKNVDVVDVIPTENLGFADFGGGTGYNPWDPRQNLFRIAKPDFSPRKRSAQSRPGDH